jgi:hypothetical protein
MAMSSLPAAFSDLAPLVVEWALPTERERALKCVETDIEQLKIFHDAMFPRIHEIARCFNPPPNDPNILLPEQKALYHLAQMFMEARAAIDLDWYSGKTQDNVPKARSKM